MSDVLHELRPSPHNSRRRSAAAILLVAPMAVLGIELAPIFSDDPIVPAWLGWVVAEIAISAESIESHGVVVTEVELPLSFDRGMVTSRGSRLKLGDGDLKVTFRHDPEGHTYLSGRGHDIHLGRIDALDEYVDGVPVGIAFDLEGMGGSAREIAASAAGHLKLRNTAGGAIKKFAGAKGNPLVELLAVLNPFQNKNSATPVECLAIELHITNGAGEFEHGFELQTQRINVIGGGRIDLAEETLHIVFKPEARQGVNLSSLAAGDVVTLQGSLASPEVKIMTGPVLEKAFSLGATVATLGGLTSNRLLCANEAQPKPSQP